MKSWFIRSNPESTVVELRDVLPAFASGHLKPVIDKVFPFAELTQAKAHMESNVHLGKIILRCG